MTHLDPASKAPDFPNTDTTKTPVKKSPPGATKPSDVYKKVDPQSADPASTKPPMTGPRKENIPPQDQQTSRVAQSRLKIADTSKTESEEARALRFKVTDIKLLLVHIAKDTKPTARAELQQLFKGAESNQRLKAALDACEKELRAKPNKLLDIFVSEMPQSLSDVLKKHVEAKDDKKIITLLVQDLESGRKEVREVLTALLQESYHDYTAEGRVFILRVLHEGELVHLLRQSNVDGVVEFIKNLKEKNLGDTAKDQALLRVEELVRRDPQYKTLEPSFDQASYRYQLELQLSKGKNMNTAVFMDTLTAALALAATKDDVKELYALSRILDAQKLPLGTVMKHHSFQKALESITVDKAKQTHLNKVIGIHLHVNDAILKKKAEVMKYLYNASAQDTTVFQVIKATLNSFPKDSEEMQFIRQIRGKAR